MILAAIVLAAGASRRLGHPKQLVSVEGEPLLRRTARLAREAGFAPVLVVLGAGAEECREALAGLDVGIQLNPAWEEGMGSSVRAGVAALPADAEAALLLVCDQPALDGAVLGSFHAEARRAPNRVLAAAYGGTLGVPALFPHACFPELLALAGDRGAKALLMDRESIAIPFPGGERDLDTPGDLGGLRV